MQVTSKGDGASFGQLNQSHSTVGTGEVESIEDNMASGLLRKLQGIVSRAWYMFQYPLFHSLLTNISNVPAAGSLLTEREPAFDTST